MEKRMTRTMGILLTALLLLSGCNNAPPADTGLPSGTGFNFSLRYGVNARNEIDTFNGKFTKDMVADPPVTIDFSLTPEEMDRICAKMAEIDFFCYPPDFAVSVPAGGLVSMVTPFSTYIFKVQKDSSITKLRWEARITNPDEKADKLKELINLIIGIIEAKEEYKALPKPTSGYL
jgi:hypothetical protein